MRGIYIILENAGGPIDSKFVPFEDGQEPELNEAVYDAMTSSHWIFSEGDTLKFREGEEGLTLFQLAGQAYS